MNRTNLVSAVAVVIALVSTTQAQTLQPKPIDHLRVEAARGDAQAMFDLGLAYQTGKEIPKDRGEAATWFRKAAAAGNADAAYRLGMMHENIGPGVSHDEAEAAAWYTKAATQGHGDAMFFLGIQYWAGRGVPQDFVEAYKWLDLSATYSKSPQSRKQAADARDSVARAKAMSPQRVALGQAQARAWREQFERGKK